MPGICGCRACERRERKAEIDRFIDTTCAFRDIMHASYKPDEEANLRLLANRLAATIPLPLKDERDYGDWEWADNPHPLEPPESIGGLA